MTRLSDELLMAYADGALPDSEASRVAHELESNAEARATVEQFRRAGDLSRAAFVESLNEPVPDALVRTVLAGGPSPTNVSDLASHRVAQPARWHTALPLAASIVLAIALGAALLLRPLPLGEHARIIALGPVASTAPLAGVLERHSSGVPVPLAGRGNASGGRLMAVATFRDRKERICREVELLDNALQPQMAGVACRDPAHGTWSVEGVARITAPAPSGNRDFVPSGAAQQDALDGLLAILGATRAVPADEEQRLLTHGWK